MFTHYSEFTFFKVYSTLYSYAPFAILFIVNIMLIIFIKQKSLQSTSPQSTTNRKSATNRTIVLVTVLFIVMTGPEALGTIFIDQLFPLSYGQYILFLLDEICFSYHAISIIFLYFTNKRFSNELKAVFEFNTSSEVRLKRSFILETRIII